MTNISHSNEWFQKVTVAPGIELPKALAEYWPAIEKTKRPFVEINAIPGLPSTTRQSSFGYFPALPLGFPYPKDFFGNWMYPLAQINFSEVPALPNFPATGYLQFYISAPDNYGLDFYDPKNQETFRVLFFEEDELQELQTDYSFLSNILSDKRAPVHGSHTLSFIKKETYMGCSEIAFEENFSFRAALEKKHPLLFEDLEEQLWLTFPSLGHRLAGYAYFTQSDPRAAYSSNDEHFQLLFQMDSDDKIMWGDMGVANFFIDPADLIRKDFSQVLYNWDCC